MIIYRVTNLLNCRQYIGRTWVSMRTRWLKHCRQARVCANPNIALHGAIRKYGKDVFIVEQLGVYVNASLLAEAERRCIAEHLDWGIRLYNMTEGGDGSPGLKHRDTTKQKLRMRALSRNLRLTSARCKPCVIDGVEYPSITEAARTLRTNRMNAARWASTGIGRRKARRSDFKGRLLGLIDT